VVLPDSFLIQRRAYVVHVFFSSLCTGTLAYACGLPFMLRIANMLMIFLLISLLSGYHYRPDTPDSFKQQLRQAICTRN
ncbi:hypothetical protein, partial [Chromobacterium amazonense]|uniref:hypothetical protein n=1 Tax=Chromobacterium amazonense TaxID=1382803 RepID=UPI003F7A86C0